MVVNSSELIIYFKKLASNCNNFTESLFLSGKLQISTRVADDKFVIMLKKQRVVFPAQMKLLLCLESSYV